MLAARFNTNTSHLLSPVSRNQMLTTAESTNSQISTASGQKAAE